MSTEIFEKKNRKPKIKLKIWKEKVWDRPELNYLNNKTFVNKSVTFTYRDNSIVYMDSEKLKTLAADLENWFLASNFIYAGFEIKDKN